MNPIMQPIINKYVVLYVAHPFGGDLDNVSRAEIQLSKLRKLLPLGHQKQTVPEKDCLFLFTQKGI